MTVLPELKFRVDINRAGFETKNTSFMTAAPTPVVRELIQNSLDAAQEVKRSAEVLFSVENHPIKDIPGIDQYNQALDAAFAFQKQHGGSQWQKVATDMQKTVKNVNIPILFVIDNGVGLDSVRMTSLLSEGLSNKGPQSIGSAGSYGVGHIEAFAASTLRYVLYGGVHQKQHEEESDKTAAGHAVIAGWIDKHDKPRSADGYYVLKLLEQKNPFVFPTGKQIPKILVEKLKLIKNKYETGSVVAITAFNKFLLGPKENPGIEIIHAAARHFFVAIHQNHLTVTVKQDKKSDLILNKDTLEGYLEQRKDNKRAVHQTNLSGERVWNCYKTLVSPEQDEKYLTEFGTIQFFIRQTPKESKSRINICRNGMWITHEILDRWLSKELAVYSSMNVLVLAGSGKTRAWNLIRRAEGPRHIGPLEPKRRLKDRDCRDFNKLIEDIHTGIIAYAQKPEDIDEFVPDDFMVIGQGVEIGGGIRNNPIKPAPIPPDPPEPTPIPDGTGTAGGKMQSKLTKLRGGKNITVMAIAEEIKNSFPLRRGFKLKFYDTGSVGLRILLENGTDQSCDNPLFSDFLKFKKAMIDGNHVKSLDCEMLLEGIQAEKIYRLEVVIEEELPETAVFRMDAVKRSANAIAEYIEVVNEEL